ncbi:MAG: co-chaperone GroES [Armatimonadetes bacterium]|nr:co-chaperone GroES [Armatimonadota bacterium]
MLRPLGDHILVKPGEAEQVTASGLVLPDTAQKKPREGEVLAVGPGKLLESGQRAPMEVSVGDVVVYAQYGGTEVTVDGEDYVILDEGSVLAVKTGAPAKSKKKSSR